MFTSFKLRRIALLGALWIFAARTTAAFVMTGTLVGIEPDSLLIRLPPRGHMTPVEIPVGFSWMSRVTSDDIALSGSTERVTNLSELTAGETVTLDVRDGWAVAVRIRPNFTFRGTVTRAADGKLVVREAEAPRKLATFALEPGARIRRTPVEHARSVMATAADITAGANVMVLGKEGRAFLVSIEPRPALQGVVLSQADGVLAVRVRGGASESVRQFQIDAHTEIYDDYFGEGAEPGSLHELVPSALVQVAAVGDRTTAISIMHPAISGMVASVRDGVIQVRVGGPQPRIIPFTTAPNTKYFIGVKQRTETGPDGHKISYYNFEPGGTIEQVKVGDKVSITAKGQLVLSMRVTPIGPEHTAIASKGPS